MKMPRWVIDITELLDLPVEERADWIHKWHKANPTPLPELSVPRIDGPTERQILQAKAQEHGFGFVDLERVVCRPDALAAVPRELVTKLRALPVLKEKMTIWCAFSEMPSQESLECLRSETRCRVVVVLTQEASLTKAIRRYYGD